MVINLWLFCSISVIFGTLFIVAIAIITNKRKMKELEVEALKAKNVNLKVEIENAVKSHLQDQVNRIEVLEAIVTDKNYDLHEKITNLK